MITPETVQYIASLSRLHLSEVEMPRFAKDLEDILHYVEQLDTVDVADVKPTSHVLNVLNVFRSDEVKPSLSHTDAVSFAIDQYHGFYKVPKVIE